MHFIFIALRKIIWNNYKNQLLLVFIIGKILFIPPKKNSKASSVDAFILLIDGKWKIKNRLKKKSKY